MPRAKAYSLFITCPYTWLCVRGDVGERDYNWLKGPLFTACAPVQLPSTPPLQLAETAHKPDGMSIPLLALLDHLDRLEASHEPTGQLHLR
jgi:hypothetical protein